MKVNDIKDTTDKLIIDKAIAKLVFGDYLVFDDKNRLMATSKRRLDDSLSSGWMGYDCIKVGEPEDFCISLPHYTQSIDDAWLLVEKMAEEYQTMVSYINNKCYVSFVDKDGLHLDFNEAIGITSAPLQICKTFLIFKGIEEI